MLDALEDFSHSKRGRYYVPPKYAYAEPVLSKAEGSVSRAPLGCLRPDLRPRGARDEALHLEPSAGHSAELRGCEKLATRPLTSSGRTDKYLNFYLLHPVRGERVEP